MGDLPVCHFCSTLVTSSSNETDTLRARYVSQCSDLVKALCGRVDILQKSGLESTSMAEQINKEIWSGLCNLRDESNTALEANPIHSLSPTAISPPPTHNLFRISITIPWKPDLLFILRKSQRIRMLLLRWFRTIRVRVRVRVRAFECFS